MQHNLFGITDRNAHLVSYQVYSSCGSNASAIDKRKQILLAALQQELTERQRECIVLYYYENMKMCEIASMLSLSPSTVTRHIKAGEHKLKNLARYY